MAQSFSEIASLGEDPAEMSGRQVPWQAPVSTLLDWARGTPESEGSRGTHAGRVPGVCQAFLHAGGYVGLTESSWGRNRIKLSGVTPPGSAKLLQDLSPKHWAAVEWGGCL